MRICLLPLVGALLLLAACTSGARVQAAQDAGSSNSSDVGDAGVDGGTGPVNIQACDPVGGPGPAGSILTVGPGDSATIESPQAVGWQTLSSAMECAAILPRSVPGRRSWAGPDATQFKPYCDPPILDGEGNFTAFSLADTGVITAFLPADGSPGATLQSFAANEAEAGLTPQEDGFLLLSHTGNPRCNFLRRMSPQAEVATAPMLIEAGETDSLNAAFRNPAGGYVEVMTIDRGATLQLRWVDETLAPLGDWHTVLTSDLINAWNVYVDQSGKALVLSFLYPPSLGGTAPPSTWQFSGRWMDKDGPLGAAFVPPAPVFTSSETTLFATWGNVVALIGGGFAMFSPQVPASSGGTISPAGWYAYYPSGQSTPSAAPDWLKQYDSSLRLVSSGTAYATLRRDAATCARTAIIIGPSGQACYSLTVDGTDGCDLTGNITPEGSLVLRNGCQASWWPLLLRPAE